ncbi:MAG: ATP-binding cassette domain-containing protein [Crocinitomicaceae bacterium]|nr:ATP-binding cassette domain-containing protein [Crocinitomicaceae bacterium]
MLRPNKKREKREKLSKDSIQKAKKIFSYLKPYRGLFLIGWIFLVLSSSIGLIFPILMGQLLGTGSDQPSSMQGALDLLNVDNVTTYAFALFVMFAAQAIFSFIRVVTFTNVTENTLRDIRKDAFERLIYMPMDFFNKNKVGELTSRISSDIEKVQEVLRTTTAEFFRQLIMIVGSVTFLVYISPKLALIMLATVPVMAIIAVFFGRFIKKLSKKAQDEAASSNGILEEALMGISNVKSFTNEVFMLGKYVKSVNNIRALNVKSGLWRGVFISFLIFCMSGAIVIVVWQGLLMTQGPTPELSRGDFFTCMLMTIMMGMSFGSIPDMYATIQKAIGATENLMNIIDTDNEKDTLTGKSKPVINGNVSFNAVTFSYPQRKDVEVLKGLEFNVTQNQTIALVGPSGAGKSTIASLLLNYYPITGGNIHFDGVSISDIETEHLRSHMAIVPQEVILFGGSINENIAFGDLEATEEQIIEAAKKANAWEFISGFPEGLNTEVGDRGIQLSGGQKQRIAIARAILRDPKILILDEATSALDSESEKLVQDALNTLMEGRTSFVIAHRLSTIKQADNIFVIDDGNIKETGKHDDLIASQGIYANLVELQGVNAVS